MTIASPEITPAADAEELGEEDIVQRIFEAVVEQRLPPGTKLAESTLCEAFGVGRMRIRRALLLLASREVVDLLPNRGAFVASPTAAQAREIFEARLALEPTIARLAVERATPQDIETLRQHLEMEYEAHRNGRRRDAIRLSGQFHTLMAEIANNSVMLRMVQELVTRTSLIIGIYGAAGMTNCRDDDHACIVDAFLSANKEKAAEMMTVHLHHIQAHLDLTARSGPQIDLMQVFRKD